MFHPRLTCYPIINQSIIQRKNMGMVWEYHGQVIWREQRRVIILSTIRLNISSLGMQCLVSPRPNSSSASYYQKESSQSPSLSMSLEISLEKRVLLELYLLRLVYSSMKMESIASRMLICGLAGEEGWRRKWRKQAKPCAILRMFYSEDAEMVLYSLARTKYRYSSCSAVLFSLSISRSSLCTPSKLSPPKSTQSTLFLPRGAVIVIQLASLMKLCNFWSIIESYTVLQMLKFFSRERSMTTWNFQRAGYFLSQGRGSVSTQRAKVTPCAMFPVRMELKYSKSFFEGLLASRTQLWHDARKRERVGRSQRDGQLRMATPCICRACRSRVTSSVTARKCSGTLWARLKRELSAISFTVDSVFSPRQGNLMKLTVFSKFLQLQQTVSSSRGSRQRMYSQLIPCKLLKKRLLLLLRGLEGKLLTKRRPQSVFMKMMPLGRILVIFGSVEQQQQRSMTSPSENLSTCDQSSSMSNCPRWNSSSLLPSRAVSVTVTLWQFLKCLPSIFFMVILALQCSHLSWSVVTASRMFWVFAFTISSSDCLPLLFSYYQEQLHCLTHDSIHEERYVSDWQALLMRASLRYTSTPFCCQNAADRNSTDQMLCRGRGQLARISSMQVPSGGDSAFAYWMPSTRQSSINQQKEGQSPMMKTPTAQL